MVEAKFSEAMKSKEELQAIRVAQKRLAWIENVKRVYDWDQERAEKEWTKIFNSGTTKDLPRTKQP